MHKFGKKKRDWCQGVTVEINEYIKRGILFLVWFGYFVTGSHNVNLLCKPS